MHGGKCDISKYDALEQIHGGITIFLPPDTFRSCYATNTEHPRSQLTVPYNTA